MLCDSPSYKITSEPTLLSTSKSASGSLNYTNYDEMLTSPSLTITSNTNTSSSLLSSNLADELPFNFNHINSTSCSTSLSNESSLSRNQDYISNNENRTKLISNNNNNNNNNNNHRTHPNIHHHPAIHPHTRHQRSSNSGSNKSLNSATKMPENNANSTINNMEITFCDQNDTFNSNNGYDTDNIKEIQNERYETEKQIKQIQQVIDQLNSEIFQNPINKTRPPSEYLEIYNSFTAQLHYWQEKRETLDLKENLETKNKESNYNGKNFNSNENSNLSDYENDSIIIETNDGEVVLGNHRLSLSPNPVDLPVKLESNDGLDSDLSNVYLTLSNGLDSDSNYRFENNITKKLPVSKSQNNNLNHITNSNTSITTNNNFPKIKLDHPTSLCPNISSNNLQTKFVQTPTTPTSPISNYSNLFPISPTVTSINGQQYSLNINGISDSCFSNIPTSQSSISLPLSIANLNIITNGQSINNYINGVTSSTSILNGQNSITPTTLSPSSSLATTPTSSFLRIYIGSSTAVIEKKQIPLREALISKLRSRNLEINNCVAYKKESNIKVDWETIVNKLDADQIVVSEIGDEIRHSFEKKTFTVKSCDSCKKRFLLNVYSCSKCNYVMCQRNECRNKMEQTVCVRKMNNNSLVGAVHTMAKPEFTDLLGRPESPIREPSSNISQQILPVSQLKVSIPSRDRSRSETELNMFVNPSKISVEVNRPVQKSPSTSTKITAKNSIYSTIPRNQGIKSSNSDIDGISGSVNEESGSVLNSISGKNLNTTSANKPDNLKAPKPVLKQHKPSRRDSFNSWEIPFHQIKIDMHKKVGSGSFGIVHQGRDFYHGTVAIKFLNVQNPTPNQSNAFRNEVAILKSTRHDNILLFIGCILKPYLAIVTEWCPGSSLYRHIHVEDENWEMNQIIDIAKQTSTGMEYLHARDILHRDLKSNNIFLIPKEPINLQQYRRHLNYNNRNQSNALNNFDDFLNEQDLQKWTVKIGDFGLATVKSTWTQTSAKTNQPTGSILWMAPEVIRQKVSDPYTQKSDVYSYAVVLYELVTGHLPYQQKDQNTILFMVGSGRLKLNPEDSRNDTPNELKELLVTCSQYDRDKRLDFVEINQKLKKIKLAKTKLQRAQSVPNVSFSLESSHMSGLSIYEDEIYPTTPQLDLMPQLNSQNPLSLEFREEIIYENPTSNNLNDNENITSHLITNF